VTTIEIVDVGPRDGLQNAPVTLAPADRAGLTARLLAAGLSRVEAVSFVDPRRVSQMAGAEEVIGRLDDDQRNRTVALVLNRRGYERALDAGLPALRLTFAASDTFNRRNSGMSTQAGLRLAREILPEARARGLRTGVVLATSFGCPFEGEVAPERVTQLAAQLAATGVDELIFADTIGVATPRRVSGLVATATGLGVPVGVHLHNTRNSGYANAYAALEAGAVILDASIGGLGGCPFAPGATGNIATEDLVYMLDRDGIDTGVDLAALVEITIWLRDAFGLSPDGLLHRVTPFPPTRAVQPSAL
jgi:isopropylmalate/homocitrate/citramalate synthase